jgi:hypothetical protein
MNELPDINKCLEFTPHVRIIQTPNFSLRGNILPKYPEDIIAYYYAARVRAKRMEINRDKHAKNAGEMIEKFLDTWGSEATTYIRTSYEKDAAMMIEAYANTSIADVKGWIYERYWSNREERELLVSRVISPNGKVLLTYKGESVVPDMTPQPLSFFLKNIWEIMYCHSSSLISRSN